MSDLERRIVNFEEETGGRQKARLPLEGKRGALQGSGGPGGYGSMLQMSVFLTGLALTVIAYFVLSVFTLNMSAENSRRTISEFQSSVIGQMTMLDQSIRSIAVIMPASVSFLESSEEKVLTDRLRYAVPGLEKFDLLIWLYESEDGWRSRRLTSPQKDNEMQDGLPIFTQGGERELYDYIINSRLRESDDVIVATELPGTKYVQENAEPVVRGSTFALGKIVKTDTGRAMVVGITRVSHIVDTEWLSEKNQIKRIAIRDSASGRPIYYMDRFFTGEERMETGALRNEIILPIGNSGWVMQMDVGKGREMRLLENAPMLVLVAGVTFTFLCMMFVRNIQKQSHRLTVMNRTLAQKNYEMNTQAAERDRLNQELRRTEQEYRTIIDAVNDIIFETTVGGEIVFLNDSWERITGFAIDQSMNRNLLDLIHPQDQDGQRQNFEQMIKGKRQGYHLFTRLRTSSGGYRAVEMSISVLRRDESKNMRVVGTVTDIEERRRAEKALSEAEKKYRTIVENAAGGIYQVTADGQFLSVNPAMAGILGYESPEQLLREVKNAHTSLYASIRDREQFINKLESFGMARNFETQIIRRDGQKIWISENARTVKDDDGNILYFEGSIENITRRKEIELKMREAKMQSDLANRAKSEFLANMSHELRTPLNAIIGFSEIIKNEVLGPVENDQYKDYMKDIHDSGKRLLAIINDILDVSRIEAGERPLNESVIDMGKVVKSCVEFMKPKAEAGKLSIINLMDSSVPKIIGEEIAVRQIFLNLLSNAVKFTGEGGNITLSHEKEHDGQLRISITDTGVGLDESEIEKALSPFGQIETSFNRTGTGTGLGLTLVSSLIKLHGGRLEIFSQKGIGTTASVILPAKRVAQEGKEDNPGAGGRDKSGSLKSLQ